MSHETFELLRRLRTTQRRAAMATLVRTKGTTPRKEGTKMFVGDDGGIFGSVTIGGCVDARVIEEAAATAEPHLIQMDLGDEEAWEIGLTCGGSVEVFFEPLTAELLELYERAEQAWAAGRSAAIATDLGTGAHAFLERGDFPAQRSGIIRRDERDVYVEILRPPPRLYIFGAGAVAIPLVTFAKELGFRVTVIDARGRFANRLRFPTADDIQLGIPSEIAAQVPLGASTPLVLVAHDYKIDVPVLKRALATDAPYIGLLGSRRRGAAILQMLRDEGVDEQQLERVRNPIGLDLGGESAAEIALAVIAEVIAVMRGRGGGALSAKATSARSS